MDGIPNQAADGVRWCSICRQHGQKSRLRKFQINFDECILLCSHAKCPSEVENPSSCSVILKRKASEIPNLRKRRKTAQEAATATVKLAPRHRYDSALLLQNEDALCWLDSSIMLLVFCESLRECLNTLPGDVSLKWLCREFDDVQNKFWAIYSSGLSGVDDENGHLSTVIPENVGETSGKFEFSCGTTRMEPVLSESVRSLEDSLDLMKFLEEDTSAETLPVTDSSLDRTTISIPKLPVGGNSLDPQQECQNSKVKSELAEPLSILRNMREKIWQELQPQLRCEKGQEETPVFALPVLLRHNKHFEAHFETSYHWEFCCRACNFTETTVGKSIMPSLKTVMNPLNMSSPYILRPCFACNATEQRSKLVFHSLPACPMFHFIEGIPPVHSWSQLNFIYGGYQYLLSAIIQYKQNPNHFVAWIKDNRRNLWLQGDDLKSPISHWSREEPTIPFSEVHVVLWERQGDCKDCSKLHTAAQCIIEADNLDMIKPFNWKEGFCSGLSTERCFSQRGKKKQFPEAYIPKAGKHFPPSSVKEIVLLDNLEEKAKEDVIGTDKENKSEEKAKDDRSRETERESSVVEKKEMEISEKQKGTDGSKSMGSERGQRNSIGSKRDGLKCRQPAKTLADTSETRYTGKWSPDVILESIPSQIIRNTRFPSSRDCRDSGPALHQQKTAEKVVQRLARSRSTARRELCSWLPKGKVVSSSLASKFAFLHESLPSCTAYKEKIARARRKSELAGLSSTFKKGCDSSRAGSLRSLRLSSVSPTSSPSGSSESCSLPDNSWCSTAFPDLDDFCDEFVDKNVMVPETWRDGEMSNSFEDFLDTLDM